MTAKRATHHFLLSWSRREQPRSLALLGRTGTGKTTLATAAADWVKSAGIRAQTWHWGKIIKHLRRGNFDLIDHLNTLPFLVIDDIGATHESHFTQSVLSDLFQERLGKWTIYTSNFLFEELADIDTRISSRLLRNGGKIFTFEHCPDYAVSTYEPINTQINEN